MDAAVLMLLPLLFAPPLRSSPFRTAVPRHPQPQSSLILIKINLLHVLFGERSAKEIFAQSTDLKLLLGCKGPKAFAVSGILPLISRKLFFLMRKLYIQMIKLISSYCPSSKPSTECASSSEKKMFKLVFPKIYFLEQQPCKMVKNKRIATLIQHFQK